MMCKMPYQPYEGVFVGCGRCLHCRVNKAREWQHRLLLEQMCWELTCFVTLTYKDEELPGDGSVDPRELQLFMKRLRRKVEPLKIRFYGVGEYGDESGRPHYHVALFGIGAEYAWCDEVKGLRGFSYDRVVEQSWSKGHISVGELNKDSARYISNYVTKFMNFEKSKKLKGRHPEFARMSNRPSGIGGTALLQMAEKLLDEGFSYDTVVSELHYGKKSWPMGSYLTSKLHELRGGDIFAADRESRARLNTLGLEYCDKYGIFRVSELGAYASDAICEDSRDSVERVGYRQFVMDKSKAKRFRAERKEKLFEKRRTI